MGLLFISKLMLLVLDLLQVPSDVTFETLTAELKSLLLEEKNWISVWLRKLKIKHSCSFVLSPLWGRKPVFFGVFPSSYGLENLCALPLLPGVM